MKNEKSDLMRPLDSAIMISGAYFAAKYFNDPEITALANSIGTTPNYDTIFDGDNGNRMYMVWGSLFLSHYRADICKKQRIN